MDELSYATVFNDIAGSEFGVGAQRPASVSAAWDAGRARACVCDAAWSGINCASKVCPYGNDYLATRANTGVAVVYQKQVIAFAENESTAKTFPSTGVAAHTSMHGKTFALTYTSAMGERFTTVPIKVESTWATASGSSTELAVAVKSALEGLPNRVISNVNVVAANAAHNSVADTALTLEIEFGGSATDTATQGNQNLLEVSVLACGAGCTPSITGLHDVLVQWSATAAHFSSITQTVSADYNSYECGRRGKCDTDTGICACFEGFTGEACSEITALV
jgi:hypothetical protein